MWKYTRLLSWNRRRGHFCISLYSHSFVAQPSELENHLVSPCTPQNGSTYVYPMQQLFVASMCSTVVKEGRVYRAVVAGLWRIEGCSDIWPNYHPCIADVNINLPPAKRNEGRKHEVIFLPLCRGVVDVHISNARIVSVLPAIKAQT